MSVVLVDVSLQGARIEHHIQVSTGLTGRLCFEWDGRPMTLDSTVVRTKLERFSTGADGLTVYHSGLLFRKSGPESERVLRDMIAWHITKAMDEQRANARGDEPPQIEHMPIFRAGVLAANRADVTESVGMSALLPTSRIVKESAYVTCRLVKNSWRRTRTTESAQPEDGFTVSATEEPTQIDMLCDTYRQSDEEGRRLIRMLAEMSIADGEKLTSRKFEP